MSIEKINVNGITYDIRDVEDVATEIARAQAAEQQLRSSIDTEVARATVQGEQLQNKIKAETERATSSDTVIVDMPLSVTGYYINADSGKLQTVAGKGYCGLIPVRPGDIYLYTGQATAQVVGVAGYDADGNFLNKIILDRDDAIIKAGVCKDAQFTIPEGVTYIACSTNNQSNYPLGLKKIYTAIEYEKRPLYTEVAYNKMRGFSIITTNGNTLNDDNSEASDFIPVKEGEIVLYSGLTSGGRGVACYDSSKKHIAPLMDSSIRDGVHFIAGSAIDALAVIPKNCAYIRASTADYINSPLSIKIVGGSTNYGKKFVWFGDSISQLGSLPHQVGKKMCVEVVDVSFAGAPLTYSSSIYQATGFMELVNCIVAGNYTPVENALAEQEATGANISAKLINLENLKSINWTSVTDVVIMAGTNDLMVSATTLEKIESGLSSALQKLITKYPHLSIYFVSPPYRTQSSNDANGLTIKGIIDTIKGVCEEFNIPFLSFYKTCGINQYNKAHFLSDGLHPTLFGEGLMSTKLANWLQSV